MIPVYQKLVAFAKWVSFVSKFTSATFTHIKLLYQKQGVQCRMVLVVNFCIYFFFFFSFVVTIFDQVYDLEAIFHLP